MCHPFPEDEQRHGDQEADMDAEVLEQGRVGHAGGQRAHRVARPNRDGQPGQESEEERPPYNAQASARDQPDATLNAKKQVVSNQRDPKFRFTHVCLPFACFALVTPSVIALIPCAYRGTRSGGW
jgi:hypothetical protein